MLSLSYYCVCVLTHPAWRVDGGKSIQVGHWELQASSPQVLVHQDHPRQGGGATEGIGPRLSGTRTDMQQGEVARKDQQLA